MQTSLRRASACLLWLAMTSVPYAKGPTKTESGPIPDAIWQVMQGRSWHADLPCPARDKLVLLTVPYIDFDSKPKSGQLIVAKEHADAVAKVFDQIFADGTFRIERMELIDKFDGDDDASMAANNTSAFNCRYVGGTTTLSAHALGIAIDINPVPNPFVKGTRTFPSAGKAYDEPNERKPHIVGILLKDDTVVSAFKAQGWKWGGDWSSSKDYQHFSQNGR
ncbi:M15 family metallopeptidase [Rhizobium laguerreae]|nr:M15 family metallopeptidase [Rhizobium laguerreae]